MKAQCTPKTPIIVLEYQRILLTTMTRQLVGGNELFTAIFALKLFVLGKISLGVVRGDVIFVKSLSYFLLTNRTRFRPFGNLSPVTWIMFTEDMSIQGSTIYKFSGAICTC